MRLFILCIALLASSAVALQLTHTPVSVFNPDGSVPYQFTYGVIRGMQAQTQFEGQCWSSAETFLSSLNSTRDELSVAYLP